MTRLRRELDFKISRVEVDVLLSRVPVPTQEDAARFFPDDSHMVQQTKLLALWRVLGKLRTTRSRFAVLAGEKAQRDL